jgi:aryl-alcohol dehydrogenase
MKVQAAVHFGDVTKLVVRETDLEDPRPDEALIRTVACGVCHTDIWVQQNYDAPMILGHEASGIVERVGSDIDAEDLAAGDHVVTTYNWCGECEACRQGRSWECGHFDENFDGLRPDGTTPFSLEGKPVVPLMREGGFAARMVCRRNSVIKVDPSLDLRFLGPLGCGIMTGAGSVLNYLRPEPGRPTAVFGAGCVGLSAVMAARIAGCDPIIAIDRVPSRLEMSMELGATHCVDSDGGDVAKIIKSICGGVDYAFDTSGSAHLLDAMRKVLNPGASACGVGIGGGVELSGRERQKGMNWEVTNTGFSFPPLFIPRLLEYYKAGQFPFEKMIRFYRFAEIGEAFAASRACAAIKPVVLME